ncbi:class F sortase [Rhodococcus sp. NPDC057135]|uniref:class F sortase n=1 Tax=Rhodococcus sp. NPDC057135 TaxID=3346028 RepID=UPI003642712C
MSCSRSPVAALAVWCAAAMIISGCAGAGAPAHPEVSPPAYVSSAQASEAESPAGSVVAAPPQRLDIAALGISSTVGVMESGQCPVLNPPTSDRAYWVQCRAQPGSDSDGTVFVIGHAVAGGDAIFNMLPDITVGADIVLATVNGTMVYQVEDTEVYTKHGEAQQSPQLRARVPGRLVVVTCFLDEGRVTDKNFVVYATLTAAYRR